MIFFFSGGGRGAVSQVDASFESRIDFFRGLVGLLERMDLGDEVEGGTGEFRVRDTESDG